MESVEIKTKCRPIIEQTCQCCVAVVDRQSVIIGKVIKWIAIKSEVTAEKVDIASETRDKVIVYRTASDIYLAVGECFETFY